MRRSVHFVGLDPRVALSAYWPLSSHFSVVRAATDARVEPEHDAQSEYDAQSEFDAQSEHDAQSE
jgi:hypothetical protein